MLTAASTRTWRQTRRRRTAGWPARLSCMVSGALAIVLLGPVTAGAALGATVSEFAVPTAASGPSGIAAGPDGALWFTESQPGTNKIGRVTTSGHMSEFPLPVRDSFRIGIAAGSDGALWFTDSSRSSGQLSMIGRITTAGTVTEFPVPLPIRDPERITAGPDGALWFTGG